MKRDKRASGVLGLFMRDFAGLSVLDGEGSWADHYLRGTFDTLCSACGVHEAEDGMLCAKCRAEVLP